MSNNILSEFPITVYGAAQPYNDVLTKQRCRIFYKGLNRNGGYITDDFAERLISTIPYTPVKGIYNEEEGDFEDHGKERNQGRIYGIVPENPNGGFEWHLDEDGVNREYYCADVLLFTAIYGEEATSIVGKSQSMELYLPSIKGDWQKINGKSVFIYTDACFLGLQVLGDSVEPCFEGAAFFELKDKLEALLDKMNEYELHLEEDVKGGHSEMPELNFKLSDSEKHNALWSLLNPNFTEEGGWIIEYDVCDVYDDYALIYNYENGCFERAYYTKNEDAVEITERVTAYIVDVTESEMNTLQTIQKLNGGSFEKAEEIYTKVEDLEAANAALETEKSEFEQKIVENDETIATLQSEKEELSAKVEEYSALSEEVESLREFKANIETNEKVAIIEKYSEKISEEVLGKYTEALADYTADSLEKELAFEMVKGNPDIFSKNNEPKPQFVPKDENITGIVDILSKYKKK